MENTRTSATAMTPKMIEARTRAKPIHRNGRRRKDSPFVRARFFCAGLRERDVLADFFLPDDFAMHQLYSALDLTGIESDRDGRVNFCLRPRPVQKATDPTSTIEMGSC